MSEILHIAINAFWLAIIVGVVLWRFVRALKRSEEQPKLIFQWAFTAVVAGYVVKNIIPGFEAGGFDAIHALFKMLFCGLAMVFTWRNSIVEAIARAFSSFYDGGDQEVEPKPFYSIAQAKRTVRKPLEAIAEVRKQLARFPNDFEGVMMLATIQAEDLKDLPGAEITLDHFSALPDAPPKQVAAAMNHLADWYLKLHQDADAARAALEKISERYPDTELALQAAQRIAHLSGTVKILLEAHDRQPMAMPEGVKNVGLLASSEFLQPEEADPGKVAAAYVKHLEQHPLDTESREKLAVIYAGHYQRLDLATVELKQLIEYPNQPAKRVPHWLNLLADLQIRGGADYETVRHTLEIIIQQYPNSALASQAESRLARVKLEIKGRQETPDKQLGTYEQSLGLKHGPPRTW